ncbi:MAG: hypothetical protein Q9166_007752 [cf. Caloplaca sp. 2 TL-2023]
MTAYKAIEQAGIIPDATPSTRRDRVGVFYGVTSNDWMETNSAQNIDAYFIPGGNRAFIPGRINYYFKFSGPSFAVDAACLSSLTGIHLVCNSLWRGDIDTTIAGGINVLINPDFTTGLDKGYFLSRSGNCKTFDDSADGYCRGEGIGTVILKRIDDALADDDPILGVIVSAYTNHSAESESITRPHSGAQREIFSKILNQGAVDPYSVSYVEMHGTGTQVGDAGEMSSVLDTFTPALDQIKLGRSSDRPLYLGSAKANIGHGEAASGVSSLIKVLLMMLKNMIVPHYGIKIKINHHFPTDLQERKVNIALSPTPWQRRSDPAEPRRAFVNNFSAAGGNSAVWLEDAPLKRKFPSEAVDPRSHHLVAVSAKTGASLQSNLRSMLGLGEYTALNAAGVLSDADTLYLVGARATLLEQNCSRNTHGMLVIKGSVEEIAGTLKEITYKTTYIKSLNKTTLDSSIVDSNKIFSFGPHYLVRHSREAVNMFKALLVARSDHIITDQTTTLEIGPHPAITGMVRAVLGPQIPSLASLQRGRPAFQILAASLKNLYVAGDDIRWPRYYYDFKVSHEVIPLPAYSWDLKSYWMQYVNDWSLRKGDPPFMINSVPTLESTTIHRVAEETSDSQKTHIVVEANIARKDLSPLVQGHEVDRIPLCTPSVYADIALSMGTYLLKRYRPDQGENLVDVSDMTISKALILRTGAAQQLLQAHAEADWLLNTTSIKFTSFDMQTLRNGITTGATARFNRPMGYRAIRPLARFHDDYRAIDEIVLNSSTLEASSRLSFGSVKRGGTYHTHPAIIDSLTQSCGFTMNCNDGTDLDIEVFMNHGWGSFQVIEPLNFEKSYNTYTHMVEG